MSLQIPLCACTCQQCMHIHNTHRYTLAKGKGGQGVASKCIQNTCHACPSRVLFIFITQSMQSFAHYFYSPLLSRNRIGGHEAPNPLPLLLISPLLLLLLLSRLTCLINGRSCQAAALFVLLNLQETDCESFSHDILPLALLSSPVPASYIVYEL